MKKRQLFLLMFLVIALSALKTAKAAVSFNTHNLLSANGEIGYLNPAASPYLGTRIGAGPNIFGLVEADDNLRLNAAGFSLRYKPAQNYEFYGDVQSGNAHSNENYGTIDPQGANLLIPGVGVGPDGTGFLLPGANNQVSNGYYNTSYDYHKVMLGVSRNINMPNTAFKITPNIGLSYKRSDTKNSFAGDIPFFARSFKYDTQIRMHSFSPTLGLNTNYQIAPWLSIFSGAEFSYDFNHATGLDTLAFTGFRDQAAKIKNNENTPSYALKAGFSVQPKHFPKITFQTNYKKIENLPVINNRDSLQKSDISYQSADVLSATIRLDFEF